MLFHTSRDATLPAGLDFGFDVERDVAAPNDLQERTEFLPDNHSKTGSGMSGREAGVTVDSTTGGGRGSFPLDATLSTS